jgi:hypothetical protein
MKTSEGNQMRTIRVKEKNLNAVIKTLHQEGFSAFPCEAPVSEKTLEQVAFESFQTQNIFFQEDTKGFAGILTDASGHQVHKIIQGLKDSGVIK